VERDKDAGSLRLYRGLSTFYLKTLYHVIISLITDTADSLTMWHGKILTLDIL